MDLKGKKVAIVGLARSGVAAAKLCAKLGAKVIVSDAASKESLAKKLDELGDLFDEVQTGRNTIDFLSKADMIIVSPGVPLAIDALKQARSQGIETIAEVEFASRFITCPIVGITGSNGKTTTTKLTGKMLELSGLTTFVGGNIGVALCELPLSGINADVAVVELSSFQLEAIKTFKVHIGAILNITEDHMDRYPSFDAYADAKLRLLECLGKEGVAVCNANDKETANRCSDLKSKILWFSDEKMPGAHISNDEIVVSDFSGVAHYSLSKFALVGIHNRENAMAAVLIARAAGATDQGIQKALDTFKPLEHRIEPVGIFNGVAVYNDSKATSVASVITALDSFEGAVVLLIGGKDKGSDFLLLSKAISKKAKAVFAFGQAGRQIADQIKTNVPVSYAGSMKEAVNAGFALCKKGDVLLLSPGCASFDEFDNYEHRGRQFKEWVHAI